MKTVQQESFVAVFEYAEREYGIGWNPCNDVFFGNAFEYGVCSDYYIEDWQGYTGDINGRMAAAYEKGEVFKASDFTKEEVAAMSDHDKSYVITSAYFESVGVTGTVQIDGNG